LKRVANVMAEQGEGVVVPTQTEVLDNVDDDLDRIELWTAALGSFQLPASSSCVPTQHREGRRAHDVSAQYRPSLERGDV
jgi:hypothetical protein